MNIRGTIDGVKSRLVRSARITPPEVILLLRDLHNRILDLEEKLEEKSRRITED
jgi:hypothetical protein